MAQTQKRGYQGMLPSWKVEMSGYFIEWHGVNRSILKLQKKKSRKFEFVSNSGTNREVQFTKLTTQQFNGQF